MTMRFTATLAVLLLIGGCQIKQEGNTRIILPRVPNVLELGPPPPPVIRQPVLPEMLVPCRGHVLVPALGMAFIARGGAAPVDGQFLREERISAPYRIITPGQRISRESNPVRLNVELDKYRRIIGFYCG